MLVTIALAGCKNTPEEQAPDDLFNEEGVRMIDEDDAYLQESIRITENNLPIFISQFEENKDPDRWFMAKLELHEGEYEEHIWIEILDLDGKTSKGLLANEPFSFERLKYLDTVYFNIYKAEDIIITKGDSIIFGNYLENLLLQNYP